MKVQYLFSRSDSKTLRIYLYQEKPQMDTILRWMDTALSQWECSIFFNFLKIREILAAHWLRDSSQRHIHLGPLTVFGTYYIVSRLYLNWDRGTWSFSSETRKPVPDTRKDNLFLDIFTMGAHNIQKVKLTDGDGASKKIKTNNHKAFSATKKL